jgi:hypothetical protein
MTMLAPRLRQDASPAVVSAGEVGGTWPMSARRQDARHEDAKALKG